MKTALIVGVSGQTGAYLAHELVQRGRRVIGTSRDHTAASWRLDKLELVRHIDLVSLSLEDFAEIEQLLQNYQPDEIYYLAGPSSVAATFRDPLVVMEQVFQPVLSFLEVLRKNNAKTRFVNSASTDCFGNQPNSTLDETTSMHPVSPYGVAKTAAFTTVLNYRNAYGLNVSNGILTNHESPLRGSEFVTQKLIQGLKEIKCDSRETLALGSTSLSRDWLWAGDVASALVCIAEADRADDFVVASGQSRTLDEFITIACNLLELNKEEVITRDESLVRPLDIQRISLNPTKIKTELGWQPKLALEELINSLLESKIFPGE